MTTHTPEELGCLAGGPARAAEVALARLIQAGLVRVSREGVLSAVHVPGARPATPLEAQILHGLRSGRHLNDVVFGAFSSSEAEGLRGHLINRGLLRRRRSLRPRLYPWLFLLAPLLMVAGVLNAVAPELRREFVPQLPEFPFWYFFAAAAAVFVWASVLRARDPGRLRTRAGYVLLKRAKRRVGPQDPVGAVAVRGLRGRIGGVAVAGMFGLSAVMIATLPGRDTTTSSSCGGGCSSDSGCSSGDSGGDSGGGCGGGCGGGGGD